MPINQLNVMDQRSGSGGHESCGYHALKNSLLSLMYLQDKITLAQLNSLLKEKQLFKALFKKTSVTVNKAGDKDITLPQFINLLNQAKAGNLDFSAQGMPAEILMSLDLSRDGNERISVVNLFTDLSFSPEYGLGGMEDDLYVAAAVAKLAKTANETNHVFALGLNNQHWISVFLQQNAQGERTWQVMNSWKNEPKYNKTVVNKIEAVLNKNELQLKQYLLDAYENASGLFNRRYETFFDSNTGLAKSESVGGWGPNEDQFQNTKEYFVDDKRTLAEFTVYIENRFNFMKTVGWLDSNDQAEQALIKQLYSITHFILQNVDETDLDVQNKLLPICNSLAEIPMHDSNDLKLANKVKDYLDGKINTINSKSRSVEVLTALQRIVSGLEKHSEHILPEIRDAINAFTPQFENIARSNVNFFDNPAKLIASDLTRLAHEIDKNLKEAAPHV